MARDVEDVQVVSDTAGINVALTAFVTANGGQYDNANDRARVVVLNGDVSAKTLTISTDRTVTEQETAITSKTFTINAGAYWVSPIFSNADWSQASTTNINIDIDDDTSVTWGVIEDAG